MFEKDNHPLEELEFLADKKEWAALPITLDEKQLTINGHPVMESWEHPYMETLARIATQNKGRVLEVGFGMGISATYIQNHNILEHHIIEANLEVGAIAEEFAAKSAIKTIIKTGLWEDVSVEYPDGFFDGILFDTYPIVKSELHSARFDFLPEASRLLKKGGVFTQYLGEVEITQSYKDMLSQVGFNKVDAVVVEVKPPSDNLYWEDDFIVAPIVTK